MLDLMKPDGLLPKDILQFVEKSETRAIEVLREIIDIPEYDTAQFLAGLQAQAATPGQMWGTGTATSLGTITGAGLFSGNQMGVINNGG